MADQKISEFTSKDPVALADVLAVIDIAGGTVNKKATINNLLDAINLLTVKGTPVVADGIPIIDSEASDVAKQITIQEILDLVPTSSWTVVESRAMTGNANEDFTNLGDYTEIVALIVAVTLSVSGRVNARVSIDNGANFLSSSGDYKSIDGAGASSDINAIYPYATNATAARNGRLHIYPWNATVPKIVENQHTSYFFDRVDTANALNAIRFFNLAGGNLTGGTIHILGR
jgi:hypothetical protein